MTTREKNQKSTHFDATCGLVAIPGAVVVVPGLHSNKFQIALLFCPVMRAPLSTNHFMRINFLWVIIHRGSSSSLRLCSSQKVKVSQYIKSNRCKVVVLYSLVA